MSDAERNRVKRNMRFDHPSWDRLMATVDAANAQGMKTNAREVAEALIRFHAPGDAAEAAKLVQSFRIAQASDE